MLLLCALLLSAAPSAEAVRRHMIELLDQLPNYTCAETVERHSRGGLCRGCEYRDRVRLEVGIAGDREVYSRAGAGKLGEREVDDLYRGGMVGTGDFGGFTSSIFFPATPPFTFAAQETLAGRPALRFTYRIAQADSTYSVSAGTRRSVVGYSGSFWVDAQSLDLERLEVQADAIPGALGITSARTAIDYQRVRIGASDYLLPRRSQLDMETTAGVASRNVATYTGCRQYVGESTIRFGDAEPAPSGSNPATPTRAEAAVPPGLRVEARLSSPIDFLTAAQEDTVAAAVTRPVRLGRRELIPKGATLSGHISFFRVILAPRSATLIALVFDSVQFSGSHLRFDAGLDPSTPHFARDLIAFRGVLSFPGSSPGIPEGFRLVWKTR